jgi:hypothetical protein
MSASTPFRRMTPHVPGRLTCRTGTPLGARLSNALRAPSSRASRGMTCEFGPFFAGGAGLLGACSQFSDTLLGVNQNFLNLRTYCRPATDYFAEDVTFQEKRKTNAAVRQTNESPVPPMTELVSRPTDKTMTPIAACECLASPNFRKRHRQTRPWKPRCGRCTSKKRRSRGGP